MTYDQAQKITFHKHEIEGSFITKGIMSALEYESEEINLVSRMVQNHQFRFYGETKLSTIRQWMRKVGHRWQDLIFLRYADRSGNKSNKGKPIVTVELQHLVYICNEIIKDGIVFFENLPPGILTNYSLKDLHTIAQAVESGQANNNIESINKFISENDISRKYKTEAL